MSKKLDLEYQYQQYLKKVNLNEANMHPVQKVETKRAFFGGCAQTLEVILHTIADTEDEQKAVVQLEDLLVQTQMFWDEQNNKRTQV